MSLYGMMRTGVSGMNAQANRLGTVSDNIANANTTGYKKAGSEFSTLVVQSGSGSYSSGGVSTNTNRDVSRQGSLQFTTSSTDLAIDGDGFFVVADASGNPFLTRAGSFVPNGNGELINSAGFKLLGYDFSSGPPSPTVNSFTGLVPVNVAQDAVDAVPTTEGVFASNLPADADVVDAAKLPSTNAADSEYTAKRSLVVYDNLGDEKLLDVYYTKSADSTWDVAAFDHDGAKAGAPFPYDSPALATATLEFDPTTGDLLDTSAKGLTLTVPGGQDMTLDMSESTQLAYEFTPSKASVNGSAPSALEQVSIGEDGTVTAQYENGTLDDLYKIAVASVASPDNLESRSGNIFVQTKDSGGVSVGLADTGSAGSIVSGALEGSNADIGEELTEMIAAQRSYTANSKVFQTGSELLDVLVNLKR